MATAVTLWLTAILLFAGSDASCYVSWILGDLILICYCIKACRKRHIPERFCNCFAAEFAGQ